MSYQLECQICQRLASLQIRAGLLQAYIDRVLPRSCSAQDLSRPLTPKQIGAAAWALAIRNCLRRQMALHARCRACTILMGPGHLDASTGTFCETHKGTALPFHMGHQRTTAIDSLTWIASGGRDYVSGTCRTATRPRIE
jgi:hypothetical protein